MSRYDASQMGNGFKRPRRPRNRAAVVRLLAGVATLGVIAASAGSALGSSPYSVKLTVCAPCGKPIAIGPGHKFKVQATGTSSKKSQLTVFNVSPACSIGTSGCTSGPPKCAKSSSAEVKLHYSHTREIINTSVLHGFNKARTALASQSTGTAYECAYLTRGSQTLAHVSVLYSIVKGAY
jgi:hypothetical protein